MTDRNRDLEPRSNPGNQQEENRGTSPRESDVESPAGGSNRNQGQSGDKGMGNEGDRNRGQGNVGSSREGGNRSGNMEGNDDLSNR